MGYMGVTSLKRTDYLLINGVAMPNSTHNPAAAKFAGKLQRSGKFRRGRPPDNIIAVV
jgi:hypothetical protein